MNVDDFSCISLLAEGVLEYDFTPNASSFAYINASNCLYKKTKDAVTMVDQNVEHLFYSHNRILFYYKNDSLTEMNQLYRLDEQGNSVLISDKCGLLHMSYYLTPNTIIYFEIIDNYSYKEYCPECGDYAHSIDATVYQMYFSKDGTNFTKGYKLTETN